MPEITRNDFLKYKFAEVTLLSPKWILPCSKSSPWSLSARKGVFSDMFEELDGN